MAGGGAAAPPEAAPLSGAASCGTTGGGPVNVWGSPKRAARLTYTRSVSCGASAASIQVGCGYQVQ